MLDSDSTSSFFWEELPHSVSSAFTEIIPLPCSPSGYSILYKAKRMGKWHILKCLKPIYANNPLYQSLFQKEFEISYTLSHPNIVQTIGIEIVDSLGLCIIQEFIEGEKLQRYIEHSETSRELAYKIVKELSMALSYIHEKQIVHRDLKPDNILITSNGKNVKLIDFGLSDMDSYSILKQPAGNRKYASPEQKSGNVAIDYTADLYALGIVIEELNRKIKDKRLRFISTRCTKVRREERFLSANEIIALLDKPITRWQKTHILIVLMLTLLVISLTYNKQHTFINRAAIQVDTIFQVTHDSIFQVIHETIYQKTAPEDYYRDERLEKLNRLARMYVNKYYDSCHKYAWDTTLSVESRAVYWHMIDTGTSYIEKQLEKEVALCTHNESEYALFLTTVWNTALNEIRKYNSRKRKK